MTDSMELSITKIIPASQQAVFDAWLDPKALAKFMTPMEGVTIAKAESDASVGGNFLIVMKMGEQELPHRGEYKAIDKYSRIVFTWLGMKTTDDSTVTLDFKQVSEKETELTLHHRGFVDEESCNNHKGGWGSILAKLGVVLG